MRSTRCSAPIAPACSSLLCLLRLRREVIVLSASNPAEGSSPGVFRCCSRGHARAVTRMSLRAGCVLSLAHMFGLVLLPTAGQSHSEVTAMRQSVATSACVLGACGLAGSAALPPPSCRSRSRPVLILRARRPGAARGASVQCWPGLCRQSGRRGMRPPADTAGRNARDRSVRFCTA